MNSHSFFGSGIAPQSLALVLAVHLAGSLAAGQSLPTALNIILVQGDGAVGRVQQRAALDPVIRVLDEREAPVNGAAVVFTLPTEGATGSFGNGAKTLTVVTDSAGAATAHGLRFNQIPGKVPVHVNVSYKGLTAHANFTEISEAPAGYKPGARLGSGKRIAIIAALAAAGAGGAALALRKSGSAPPAAPIAPVVIGITPGAGTVAPPR